MITVVWEIERALLNTPGLDAAIRSVVSCGETRLELHDAAFVVSKLGLAFIGANLVGSLSKTDFSATGF